MTNPDDQRVREPQFTICPDCGEDLEWHTCGEQPSERTLRIRALNPHRALARMAGNELVITKGVAVHGLEFATRALDAVRNFRDFTADNDPCGEHDFGSFELDCVKLFWKIDCYDSGLEYGSPNPADPEATKRVLTILLSEEY